MTRNTLRRFASVLTIPAAVVLGVSPAAATCGLVSGVKLVNGTSQAIAVTVTDACSHVSYVHVQANSFLTVPTSSGLGQIVWMGGENSIDFGRGQIHVQQL